MKYAGIIFLFFCCFDENGQGFVFFLGASDKEQMYEQMLMR